MKILYLVHRVPYPPNKGDKIRALWEIKTLAQKHEIYLFCFYDHDEDANSIEALRPYCRECYAERLSWWGSRARALMAAACKKPFSPAYFYSTKMARKVRENLRTREYDIALVFGSSMAHYVESEQHLPRLLDMVDVDSNKWAAYATNGPSLFRKLWAQEGRLLGEYEERIAHDFSRTLLCTDAEAEILKARAKGAPIDVLRHMVDTEYFDPQKTGILPEITALQPYVIFSGSMDYAPNIEAVSWFCEDIFPKVRAMIPQLKFVIAGRNPANAVLRLGKDPAVKITGSVLDVRPYLRGASAAVAPMLTARGVQNKILESMAMGLRVVASSKATVAFPPDVVKLIATEDNAEAFAQRLTSLLQSGAKPPLSEVRSGLVRVFGDVSFGEALERFLKDAVCNAGGPQVKINPRAVLQSAASVVNGMRNLE